MYIVADRFENEEKFQPFSEFAATRKEARKTKRVETKYHRKFNPEYVVKIFKLVEVR